jgi:predicted ATPase
MDYIEPKTRTEKKGNNKNISPYSSKHVRLQDALFEKRKELSQTNKKKKK